MDYSATVSEENAMNEQVLKARLRAFGMVRTDIGETPRQPSATVVKPARTRKRRKA